MLQANDSKATQTKEDVPMPQSSRARARLLARWTAGCVVLASCGAAYAANLGFLSNSPISYMKDRDLQALNKAAGQALNTKQDGEALDWSNEGAGNSVAIKGTITPNDTEKSGEQTCRKVAIVAIAKGQTQTWSPTACREGEGKWKLKKQ
jgi:surface antigen